MSGDAEDGSMADPEDRPSRVPMTLSAQDLEVLRILGVRGETAASRSPQAMLSELLGRLWSGVHLPGSWERGLVFQIFGDGWVEQMEPDPEYEGRERLRGSSS